jgi:predicted phage terminase large subunit-like protein
LGAVLELPRLRADQWHIVSHPARVKAIAMGRRWGKSTTAGAVALATAARGGKVAWVVPTYRNGRPLWRWAEIATGPLVKRGLVSLNRTERTVEFTESGGFLGLYSADNDSSIRGEWFNLAILDEAAQIAEETWTDVIQPTLADANGDAILISTPKGKNWFWREWQRGIGQMDGEYAAFTAPSSANPNPAIRRAAELAADRVPPNTYKQEWLAEFVSDANNPFDPEWWTVTKDHDARRFDAKDPAHKIACAARWISWDTALEDTASAAYSACIVGELTPDYRLFIREVYRDKLTFPNLMTQIERIARKYLDDEYRGAPKLQAIIIESKVSGIDAFHTLRATADRDIARLVVPFRPEGSKEHRADLAAVWCKQGCVWLPWPDASVPWLHALETEMYGFPDSTAKDQVDALAQLILYDDVDRGVKQRLTIGRDARADAAALAPAAQEREYA